LFFTGLQNGATFCIKPLICYTLVFCRWTWLRSPSSC